MNNKFFTIPLLICLLVTGCLANSSSAQLTVTPSTNGISTSTLTYQPTNLYRITPPEVTKPISNWEAAKKCVTVYSAPPDTYRLAGVAAVRSLSTKILGLELSLLDLVDADVIELPTPNPVDDATVSPDRKTLAYIHFNTSNLKWELTLVDATGEVQKNLWSSDQAFSLGDWLNNHQIVVFEDSKFIIVDSIEESQLSFSPASFPGFDPDLFYPLLAFDPTITSVVYKSGEINLLDLGTKTTIIHIDDNYDRAPIVAWQPSGERAAIVAPLSMEQTLHGSPDEIFIVERDGKSRQLTHLYDIFGLVLRIHSLSWSPSGEEIAFWLSDGKGNETLMVVDAMTSDVTNYCILNGTITKFPRDFPAPIWSPDGEYLMVENRYPPDKSKLLVVDLLNQIAFPVADNANPIGWMISEP